MTCISWNNLAWATHISHEIKCDLQGWQTLLKYFFMKSSALLPFSKLGLFFIYIRLNYVFNWIMIFLENLKLISSFLAMDLMFIHFIKIMNKIKLKLLNLFVYFSYILFDYHIVKLSASNFCLVDWLTNLGTLIVLRKTRIL